MDDKKKVAELLATGPVRLRVARLIAVALDVLSFVAVVGIHLLLGSLAKTVLGVEFPLVLSLVHSIFAIAFTTVYIQLTFDMVQIFVPWLRPRQKTVNETASPSVSIAEEGP